MEKPKIYAIPFDKVYPLYIQKAERKGRTKAEVDEIIFWLTGYDAQSLKEPLGGGADMEAFFENAPQINPNAHKITGVICGLRVDAIEDALTQKIRWLDKLIDELAKGKSMQKILRQ